METNFFKQAVDFFVEYQNLANEVTRLQKQNNELILEVERLGKDNDHLFYELGAANGKLSKLQENGNTDDIRWISVDEDEKPLDGDIVVVKPKNGNPRLGTFMNGSFNQRDIEAWLQLPEYK